MKKCEIWQEVLKRDRDSEGASAIGKMVSMNLLDVNFC